LLCSSLRTAPDVRRITELAPSAQSRLARIGARRVLESACSAINRAILSFGAPALRFFLFCWYSL
jgi:hypothetical protein